MLCQLCELGSEIKQPDRGVRSSSKVVELEWLQQVWSVVSSIGQAFGATNNWVFGLFYSALLSREAQPYVTTT